MASLSFHSLINLRRLIESGNNLKSFLSLEFLNEIFKLGVTLLDLEEKDLPGVAYRAVEAMVVEELIRPEDKANVMRDLLLKHKHVNENDGWKFNLRKNNTTSGSLTSLHAIMDVDKNRRLGLGSPNTVPEGLNGVNGGNSHGTVLPKMTRRNSATSRLVHEHHHQDNHHHRIVIEDSPYSPLTGYTQV